MRPLTFCFLCLASAFGLVVWSTPLVATTVAIELFGLGLSFPGVVDSRFIDNITDADQNTVFGLVDSIESAEGSGIHGLRTSSRL